MGKQKEIQLQDSHADGSTRGADAPQTAAKKQKGRAGFGPVAPYMSGYRACGREILQAAEGVQSKRDFTALLESLRGRFGRGRVYDAK